MSTTAIINWPCVGPFDPKECEEIERSRRRRGVSSNMFPISAEEASVAGGAYGGAYGVSLLDGGRCHTTASIVLLAVVAVAVGPSSRDAYWHLKTSAHMFSCAEPAQLAANQEEQMMEVGEEEREEQEEQEAAPCDLTVDGGRCHCGHCDF